MTDTARHHLSASDAAARLPAGNCSQREGVTSPDAVRRDSSSESRQTAREIPTTRPASAPADSKGDGREGGGGDCEASRSSKRPRVASNGGIVSSGKNSADGVVSDLRFIRSIPEIARHFDVGEAIGSGMCMPCDPQVNAFVY